MEYTQVCGEKLSRLGFGCMRLPLREDQSIDEAVLDRMVDYAMAHGVNYFDTAWPYHGGRSELAIGKSLSRYPRDQWFLADKPSWAEMCRQREEAARKLKEQSRREE